MGVFIDLDHWLDYWLNIKKIDFDVKEFFRKCNNYELDHFYVLLHSWEILPLFVMLLIISNYNPWIIGVSIGFVEHLILDTLYNDVKLAAYFFTNRFKHGFKSNKIYDRMGKK